jgi:alpha,alpha-trehalase
MNKLQLMKSCLFKKVCLLILLSPLTVTISFSQNTYQADSSEIKKVRSFIYKNWSGTIEYNPIDKDGLIGLPKPYNVPSVHGEKMFKELYYWDTYFTNLGLLNDNHVEQAKNNVDDILFLVNRFGKMPNGSRFYYLNRSQPPYLSMMVADIYRHSRDKIWLKNAVEILRKEYRFWMTQRITPTGLNRYSRSATRQEKIDMANYLKTRFKNPALLDGLSKKEIITMGSNYTAEAESGWDFNPRFLNRCEDFCPIDLNSNLYLYEKNFAFFYKELGRSSEISKWEKLAKKRKSLINKYCYNKFRNLYYDYDFVNAKKSPVVSAAIFSLLYVGVAAPFQAKGIVKALPLLETEYGLRACEDKHYPLVYQWGETNAWAPLQLLAVKGLMNYKYKADADRISNKYISLVCRNFDSTNNLWEKYNVIDGTVNASNEYKMPAFLGWTAGVFIYLTKEQNQSLSK